MKEGGEGGSDEGEERENVMREEGGSDKEGREKEKR